MKKLFLIVIIFVTNSFFAQYGNKDGNRIGISGGVSYLSILSSNLSTKPSLGWIGGLSVRGNYYNNWSAVFGMQFTDSNFLLDASSPLSLNKVEEINVKLSAVQVRFLLSYNVIKDHVSFDIGPVLQVNGKLNVQNIYKNYVLPNAALVKVEDILDVNKINGNIYIGTTAGTKRIRAVIFYQYGFNNLFSNLNKDEELIANHNNQNFTGNIGLLSGQLLFNL